MTSTWSFHFLSCITWIGEGTDVFPGCLLWLNLPTPGAADGSGDSSPAKCCCGFSVDVHVSDAGHPDVVIGTLIVPRGGVSLSQLLRLHWTSHFSLSLPFLVDGTYNMSCHFALSQFVFCFSETSFGSLLYYFQELRLCWAEWVWGSGVMLSCLGASLSVLCCNILSPKKHISKEIQFVCTFVCMYVCVHMCTL